jgi:hypothetical protein
MVDNDEYLNDNIIINYDSKRFSLENCLNLNQNPTDIQFHSRTILNHSNNHKRRKFVFSISFFKINSNEGLTRQPSKDNSNEDGSFIYFFIY